MTTYTVRLPDGERLDRIAKALFGSERDGATETLLDANPGLAGLGPVIPAGTVIAVPDEVTAPADATQRIWE